MNHFPVIKTETIRSKRKKRMSKSRMQTIVNWCYFLSAIFGIWFGTWFITTEWFDVLEEIVYRVVQERAAR